MPRNMPQLFANNYISDQKMPRVRLTENEKKNYLLKDGDLLFGRRSFAVEGAGKCSLVQNPPEPLTFESSIIRVTLNLEILDSKYAFYFVGSPYGRYQMYTFTRVVAVSGIAGSDLKLYRLPVPPLPEQKKIAEILSIWDKAVGQMRKLIDAKNRRKKALMQQLLTGKKRLSGFNESWKEYRLGKLFDERRESNYEHLMLLAITGSRGVIPASEIKRKDSSSTDKSKDKRIAPGDIGYNTMRMWQGVSAVSDLEGIVSPAYTICIPKENVAVRFMGYFFKFPPVINVLRRFSQGLVSDTLNLKFHNFAQIKVKIPCLDEQQGISKVLRIADDEIKQLEKKLASLEKQKRGLMQKLLTGEVRVSA